MRLSLLLLPLLLLLYTILHVSRKTRDIELAHSKLTSLIQVYKIELASCSQICG